MAEMISLCINVCVVFLVVIICRYLYLQIKKLEEAVYFLRTIQEHLSDRIEKLENKI